jgi:hypothetical protein
MSNVISVEKSKPSKVKRLKLLPRIGLVIDFAGKELTYRQVPLLETLLNLRDKKLSVKNFMQVAYQQLNEINLRKQPTVAEICGPKKRKIRK